MTRDMFDVGVFNKSQIHNVYKQFTLIYFDLLNSN